MQDLDRDGKGEVSTAVGKGGKQHNQMGCLNFSLMK